MIVEATLTSTADPGDVINLGCEFNYKPFVPKKRIKVKMTAKGSFTQKSDPLVVYGMDYIEWEIGILTCQRARALYDAYLADDTFTFEGWNNDQYLVEFSELEFERSGGYWVASGKFRVLCEETAFGCEDCPDE
jgi:hypothetical protein